MWKRATSLTLRHYRSTLGPCSPAISAAAAAGLLRKPPLSSDVAGMRTRAEDVMPIATGLEREEIEAELQVSQSPPSDPAPLRFQEAPAVIQPYYKERIAGCPGGEGGARKMHSYRVGSLSGIPIPASVDWTKSGILGPVKMQAANDCWNFAALESIAAINALTTGEYVELSKKQVNDCNWKNSMQIGGFSWCVFEYAIKNGGLVPEVIYSYTNKLERWRKIQNVPLITISDYGYVPSYNSDELCRAIARQPVVVSLATDVDFSMHQGKVLPASLGERTVNHDVLAVGYNKDSWMIMNTWGCAWGHEGFAEVPRCLDDLGGAYGILKSGAYYPIKSCENRYGNIYHECMFSD